LDKYPLGSASIAQVHKGELSSELVDKYKFKDMVVKIQHDGIYETSIGDIKLINYGTKLVENINEDFRIHWLGKSFNTFTPQELDFRIELDNMHKIGEYFKDDEFVYIPKTIDELCSHDILTMEYIDGVFIDELDKIKAMGFNPNDVMSELNNAFNRMIYDIGFVHADPHAKNILIRRNPKNPKKFQIVLLDHGLYCRISEEIKYSYCKLWQSMLNNDIPNIKL